ncbi:RHS repeat domain-containing protein [Aquimarina agarivorans]|uniref:RHS repeat domain-containing protein n=1 Tax=Aquimarina agarivorans TaxID=980584 RepID=UPI000248EF86|nr:RHS repeat-associated core domain-containing protein [Aquimarina agarivorans]
MLGDAYTAPIAHVSVKESVFAPSPEVSNEYMYLHRDHLGSIMAITDSAANVKEETHYGAWGTIKQFKGANDATTLDESSILGRGYTGHEHFASIGLIHMNGRMYDAKLGRFLSPDNFIQDPFNTQSFNRYGYVWNNPLKFNDPSGEFLITAIIIGAVVGAYIGGAQANGNWNPLKWDWSSGATWAGIGIGAVVGAIGGEVVGAGLLGVKAFGIFSVKLGVGLAVPGIGTLGLTKIGNELSTEYTNPQGETYNQNIGTIPGQGSIGGRGNGNEGPPDNENTDSTQVEADDVIAKVKEFVRPTLNSVFRVTQNIYKPIVNQASVIWNEGIHEGKAYNPSENFVYKNIYTLNESYEWTISKSLFTSGIGTPSFAEGKEITSDVITVVPSPGLNIVRNKIFNFFIKSKLKKEFKEGVDRLPNR